MKDVADSLLATMAENLGPKQEVIADRCIGGVKSVRMNYYPPCVQADKAVGFSPNSDADLLTLVLQVNHVQGLAAYRSRGMAAGSLSGLSRALSLSTLGISLR